MLDKLIVFFYMSKMKLPTLKKLMEKKSYL